MAYAIAYEDSALDDIGNILAYLSQYYPSTPRKFRVALSDRIRAIRDMPYMYPVYEDNPAFRKMGVMKYMVFYCAVVVKILPLHPLRLKFVRFFPQKASALHARALYRV
jgi:plasmid stabilization system protein ParE